MTEVEMGTAANRNLFIANIVLGVSTILLGLTLGYQSDRLRKLESQLQDQQKKIQGLDLKVLMLRGEL